MENTNRHFSVRTAYQVALRLQQQVCVEHSSARTDGPIWKKIWTLNIPPKVRTFIWRAWSNILPTRENLNKRRVKNEQRCDICGQEPEITSHILWEYPLTRNVWALVKGRLQECSNMKQDFFLLFQHLVAKLESKDLERWTVVSWAIWNLRGHRPSRR